MYYLQRTKNNIQNFKVIGDDLLYKVNGNDYYLFQNDTLIDENNYGYFEFGKYLCLNHKDSTDLIDKFSKSLNTIPVTFIGRDFYGDNFVVSKNSIREGVGLYSSNYIICQLFPFRELYELRHRYLGSGYRFENQYIQVHSERKLLKSLSLLTGEYEWEVDFSGRTYFDIHKEAQNVEISKIIGVWEQQLLITTNTYELISIDTASGKINWETNNLQSKIIKQPPYNQLFSNPYLENGKIYELVGNVYYSIDLLTQAIEILWRDERKEGFLSVAHPTYTDDYIYFTGSYGNHLISNLVGVFNRSNYKLEWAEELEIEDTPEGYATLNQAPQVSDNKLYVLDCMGLLRIFEKEN